MIKARGLAVLALKLAIAPSAILALVLLLLACLVPNSTFGIVAATNLGDSARRADNVGQVLLGGAAICYRDTPKDEWACAAMGFGSFNASTASGAPPEWASQFIDSVGIFRSAFPSVGIAYALGIFVFTVLLLTVALIAHCSGPTFYEKHLHIYRPLYLKCFAILNAYCVGMSGYAVVQALQITQAAANWKDLHPATEFEYGSGYSLILASWFFHLLSMLLTFIISALGRIHLRHPSHILKLVADVQADHAKAYKLHRLRQSRAQSSDSQATLVNEKEPLIRKPKHQKHKKHQNWDSVEEADGKGSQPREEDVTEKQLSRSNSAGNPIRHKAGWVSKHLSTTPEQMGDLEMGPTPPMPYPSAPVRAPSGEPPAYSTPGVDATPSTAFSAHTPPPLNIRKKQSIDAVPTQAPSSYASSAPSQSTNAARIVNQTLRQASIRAASAQRVATRASQQSDRSSVQSFGSVNSMASAASRGGGGGVRFAGEPQQPAPPRGPANLAPRRRNAAPAPSPIAEASEPPSAGMQHVRVPAHLSPVSMHDDDDLFSDVGIPERI